MGDAAFALARLFPYRAGSGPFGCNHGLFIGVVLDS